MAEIGTFYSFDRVASWLTESATNDCFVRTTANVFETA
jgi:hypothetical protein